MAAEYDHADAFREASFTGADFTGATFRDCDLRQVKITDSWLVDVSVSGLVGNFVVNDVDVTGAIVEGLTDVDLERVCTRLPAPGYPEQTSTVGRCLRVVMKEEIEHPRYAVRDLAVLEADLEAGAAPGDRAPA